MDIADLATLYQRALQVQDAAVRDLLSMSAAKLAATQSVIDVQLVADVGGTAKALEERARSEVESAAKAVAKALDEGADAPAAESLAAEAAAAEAIAAEALSAAAVALGAENIAAEPVAAEPVAAEPVAAEPFVAEPLAAEPFVAEPLVAEPWAAEPTVAEPTTMVPTGQNPAFSAALNAFVSANRGGD